MDEFTVVMKAREFIKKVNPTSIPAPIEVYVAEARAVLRRQKDLAQNEPGWSFQSNGKYYICVNANDRLERQRFTACHEIAHIVLGLPSNHEAQPWWSYAERSLNEICCDVFAAELLLPYHLFQPLAAKEQIGFAAIGELAERFAASNVATGSRFATVLRAPCAFVLSEQGKVRYASRSAGLRETGAWIAPRTALPSGSLSQRVRRGGRCNGPEETEADIWFDGWDRGGVLLEDVKHLEYWDQTLTLLWFEDEEVPAAKNRFYEQKEDLGLEELDGVLPWPGRRRRK